MSTTDEELDKERDRIAKLREQIAEANSAREDRERGLTNDIAKAQLQAEGARLEAELAEAKAAAKASTVKAGASDQLEVNREAEKAADERTKAAAAAARKE
jgi:hypothetical protein